MTENEATFMRNKLEEYDRLKHMLCSYDAFAKDLQNCARTVYFGVENRSLTFEAKLTDAQRHKLIDLILEFKDDIQKEIDNLQ